MNGSSLRRDAGEGVFHALNSTSCLLTTVVRCLLLLPAAAAAPSNVMIVAMPLSMVFPDSFCARVLPFVAPGEMNEPRESDRFSLTVKRFFRRALV